MAHLRKLKSGRWNAVAYSHTDENGKKKYVSFTASTKAEASRKAAEFMANKANEEEPQDIMIGQMLENYVKSKSNILSPSTYREYERCLKNYKSLSHIKLGSLTNSDLQNFINNLSKDKSPKTVENIYGLLRSALKQYSNRNFRVTLPSRKAIERHTPTDEQVKILIENANPTLKTAIILGAQGLRRSEICGLKYGDILRDFNALYVHAGIVLDREKQWVYKPYPKNASSTRRLILPKEIIDELGTGEDDEFIIKVHPSTITTDFINLRNKIGFQCRFHDLRHYMASIYHALNIPDVYIMERGGWSSDRILKDVYRNSLSDKMNSFTELANKYFSDNILSKTQVGKNNQDKSS